MNLISYYQRQRQWRSWSEIYNALPALQGSMVLDLGCGIGDQAADMVERGARVRGVDLNETALAAARSRALSGCDFVPCDLKHLPDDLGLFDGIWSSFAAAYFPNFEPVLRGWVRHLRKGGWIAITEIDDLFGHTPLSLETKTYLVEYANQALQAQRYDFRMGRRLTSVATAAGIALTNCFDVPDSEFSSCGPVAPEVLNAWRDRFDGMTLLKEFCGSAFLRVRDDFLSALERPEHTSTSRVCTIIGRWSGAA